MVALRRRLPKFALMQPPSSLKPPTRPAAMLTLWPQNSAQYVSYARL